MQHIDFFHRDDRLNNWSANIHGLIERKLNAALSVYFGLAWPLRNSIQKGID